MSSKSKSVQRELVSLIAGVNAPLPVQCRMLPDGSIFDLNTKERFYQAELNRRWLINLLAGIEIAKPEQLPEKAAGE